MKQLISIVGCGFLCLVISSNWAPAQNQPANKEMDALERIHQMELGRSLTVYGMKRNDPAALLMAAKIMHPLQVHESKMAKLKQIQGEPVKQLPWPTPAELVNLAKSMDGADRVDGLLQETSRLIKEKPKKRLPVASIGVLSLVAKQNFIFEETMAPGAKANVIFDTHGRGNLEVTVLGPKFEPIGKQTGPKIHISWDVPKLDSYKIKIRNMEPNLVMASYIID